MQTRKVGAAVARRALSVHAVAAGVGAVASAVRLAAHEFLETKYVAVNV